MGLFVSQVSTLILLYLLPFFYLLNTIIALLTLTEHSCVDDVY